MEKAFALSRSTSTRQTPQEYSPEVDADQNEEEASVQLDSRKGRGFAGASTSGSSNGNRLGGNHQTPYASQDSSRSSPRDRSSPAVDDGPGPRRFEEPNSNNPSSLVRQGQYTNGNQVSSSFSNLSRGGEHNQRSPEDSDPVNLSRRDSVSSVNTVQTAEFGAGGKWGRAWADRDDDEEGSLYGGSEWGGESNYSASEYKGAMGLGLSGGGTPGLDALRNLAKGADFSELVLSNASVNTATLQRVSLPQRADSQPAPALDSPLTSGSDRARVVSLTPSYHQMSEEPSYFQVPARESGVSVSSPSPLPGGSNFYAAAQPSTDTLASSGEQGAAHVYVWPPTPAGSEIAHEPHRGYPDQRADAADAASIHEWEAVTDDGSEGTASQRSSMASIIASPTARQEKSKFDAAVATSGPVTVTSALHGQARLPGSPLARPRGTGDRPSSVDGRKGGHPAGRLPPPPPSSHQYDDPYHAGPIGARIGRARAAAIAAADGRESIVSDLDVETLRLDGSSRRDSTSTVGSRMSIGTVRYSDDGNDVRSGSRPGSRDFAAPSRPVSVERRTPIASPASPSTGRFEHATPGASHGAHSHVGGRQSPMPTSSLQTAGQRSAGSSPAVRQAAQMSSTSLSSTPTAAKSPYQSQSPPRRSNNQSTTNSRHAIGQNTKTGPSAAENYLSQGIQYHEQGDLSRSAYYFERSAKVEGGCVVGMCMWGMTLREGWGARKDPRKGFEWIQRAAATAGELMSTSRNRTEADLKAVRSELKLSVYELGKCFCYGWGVKMDKKMALEYFELAAKLGDADAQAEAGALYAAGKGCKKDVKKAAKYYRMAAAQGYDLIGLSWVWKSKFDD